MNLFLGGRKRKIRLTEKKKKKEKKWKNIIFFSLFNSPPFFLPQLPPNQDDLMESYITFLYLLILDNWLKLGKGPQLRVSLLGGIEKKIN